MIVQYSTSHNASFCTTWGKQKQQNRSYKKREYVKKHPQHLSKCLLLHYLRKPEQAKCNISLILFPQVVQKQIISAVEN